MFDWNNKGLWLQYVKGRKDSIFLMLLQYMMFEGLCRLFDVESSLTFYLILLSFTLVLVYHIHSFHRFKRHVERLEHQCSLDGLEGLEKILYEKWTSSKKDLYVLEQKSKQDIRDMTDFYTLWVHQIKTPIAAMNMLCEEGDGDKMIAFSSELLKMEQYVDLLLAYFRLGEDFKDYRFERIDPDLWLKKSIRKFADLFIQKGLTMEYTPAHREILLDSKWFSLMIDQILSNAIKYTDQGGIKIYWEGDTLIIEDTGIGIPEVDLPRVMEKGYTGYNGRMFTNSTGVGLFIVKTAADHLHVEVGIASEVSKGTKISLRFPCDKNVTYE